MVNGWIKLYRCMMDDHLWLTSTSNTKIVMMVLLMSANHEENEWSWNGQKFKCKPGQMVTSIASIKQKCGKDISDGAVRCALNKLEKHGFITKQTTKTGTLITVVNWAKYQGSDTDNYKANYKETTKQLQTNYKETTTNKNDNNDKNDKNINDGVHFESEQPAWKSEGFSCEENYIKFLRGEISEAQ